MVFDWKTRYPHKVVDGDRAVEMIESGYRVFMTGNCSVPKVLLKALVRRAPRIQNVEIDQVLTFCPDDYVSPDMEGHLRINSMFISENVRQAVNDGRADFTPVFLSEFPNLYRKGVLSLDVALLHVSPPDSHGFVSLGVESGMVKTPASQAHLVIAEVNDHMPRVLGDTLLHISQIDYLVPVSYELTEISMGEPSELSLKIASYIAPLIEDGATVQAGIGEIPNAVLQDLRDKKDLGIHSELISDGIADLAEAGVITNARKTIHQGKIISAFLIGTRRLYDFVDDNPFVELHPIEYVNDPFVVSRNDNMVAINSAIELDLTGQVCADSIGTRFYSGVGGQLDFIYGASRSKGGRAIIALPSTTRRSDGTMVSRIVPMLTAGAGVTTTRNHVHTVVTEFGAAHLYGRNIRQRARALIDIAHPDFREALARQAHELYHL
ncbi:MAG TPA: acetyl-CoA hydrolase/transferase C-terminal domain-containing protein [Anaerolineales bacterium]